MFKRFIEDARLISKRDPASKGIIEVMILYAGFHAVCFHRVAHWFYCKKLFFIARFISQISRFLTGVEIHPGAKIGKGLFIDHGMGIVIGETAEIGDNCTIYHNATLGGTGKDTGKRHPTVGNNVLISTGAKILGPFKVGDNSRIGANSVVLDEVEPNTTVVGVPGKAVKRGDRKIVPSVELDQIHIGDPVAQELCKLLRKLENLEKQLSEKHGIDMDDGTLKLSKKILKKECDENGEGDKNENL
ncbi:serine O-acetyltransferase EpsC [Herbivorax sp. ANBcel31]|uniref:serine O-acetyltransferase EpsC n=1 Tax=Herbivorax sp. ANBcel31 TaxID=3069754 RepID=UPI0027B44EE9|nr:serine O-acetyltransferase EpsC [Herbivorax sp. ANBcel31]MDQ2086432.1 serine O-acetyltransferase EpsC [Herbivorax sp. ANBcel31]